MLNSLNLNDKTYDELIAEAVAQIPLYSREWTNYNPSDPGITMLENLTAFQQLQQESIDQVPEEAKRKLLQLMGYTARENTPATVLVQAPSGGGPILSAGHRLWSGSLPFETVEDEELNPWSLEAAYALAPGEEPRDITFLLDVSSETFAYPFGKKPGEGSALLCVLKGIPEMGEPLRLWLQVAEEELRNPFDRETSLPVCSHVRWQYYTAGGWKDARVEDETMGLLRAGMVTLWLEGDNPAVYDQAPVQGCALRCVLDQADYDRAPRLSAMAVHLFPVRQQDTRVKSYCFDGGSQVELIGRLPDFGNYFVFCKESPDGPYRAYQEAHPNAAGGRYYRIGQTDWGTRLIQFDREAYGFGPCEGEGTVLVSCYDNEMIYHRDLGVVHGFEDQVVELDLVENVLPDHFSVLMETQEADGQPGYWLVRPEETDPETLCYKVRSQWAQLVIKHPGLGGGHIYLADCVVTQGIRGNLRAGCRMEELGGYDGTDVLASYFCPAPGRGGMTYESVEELRRRFSANMRSMSVAARTDDYEKLVRETPGLCIHKVKAVAEGRKNLVRIAVQPYTDQRLPQLSEDYIRQIRAYLEPRRMLTTRFEILQPAYVPIGVKATLVVSGMTAPARAEADRLLRTILDHVNGDQAFGGWIRFHEIYQQLNTLPFVEAVESLNILPESRNAALVGSDIRLEDHSLCYPGTIQLTIQEQFKR